MNRIGVSLTSAALLLVSTSGAWTAERVSRAVINREQAWMNPALSPAERTEALIAAMTLDQKLQQIYNLPVENKELQDENPPCEFQSVGRHIEGIPELQIP